MKIRFLGASGMVTGSCYLVETPTTKFIVDSGMFQGNDVEKLNYKKYDFDPSTVNFVLLTHTHIDHSGLLPKLVRNGFKGKIYCSIPTRRLAELLLFDSAKIQEQSLREYNKKNKLKLLPSLADEHGHLAEFIYSTKDASDTLNLFESIELDTLITIDNNLSFKFVDAGHILGAVSIQMTIKDEGKVKQLLFSGDIGHKGQGLVKIFSDSKGFKPDTIVMESLYGGVTHQNRTDTVNEMIRIITDTTKRGGNVLIPSFAVQRTQEILFELKKAKQSKKLSNELEVYCDSPLALKSTDTYTKSFLYLNAEIQEYFRRNDNAFNFNNLKNSHSQRDSLLINKKKGVVIIAGSGMCDGGRILYHLSTNLGMKNTSVILVGFQAEDTLGRKLMNGEKEVKIIEKNVKVNANIYKLLGFSAHADTNDLEDYFNQYYSENLKKLFLVHSEGIRADSFKKQLLSKRSNLDITIPQMDHLAEV